MSSKTMASLIEAMKTCEQMPGLSVLQHGCMVRDYYRDLLDHLRTGSPLRFQWQLPEWITDPRLIVNLPSDEVMAKYHVFHDCGKPACLSIGEDGRRHFTNHAETSANAWLEIGGAEDIATLIREDMDIHLLKDVDVENFAKRPHACALVLTGLSEVHANASLFGGCESTSFKIKFKQINKRGNALLKLL